MIPTRVAQPGQVHAQLDADQLSLRALLLIACNERDH